jgi:hypothetical protein
MTKEELDDIKIIKTQPRLINNFKYLEKNYIVFLDILYSSHLCCYGKITIYNPISKVEYGKLLFNINHTHTNHYISDEDIIYYELIQKYRIKRETLKQTLVKMFNKIPAEIQFTLFENFNNLFI